MNIKQEKQRSKINMKGLRDKSWFGLHEQSPQWTCRFAKCIVIDFLFGVSSIEMSECMQNAVQCTRPFATFSLFSLGYTWHHLTRHGFPFISLPRANFVPIQWCNNEFLLSDPKLIPLYPHNWLIKLHRLWFFNHFFTISFSLSWAPPWFPRCDKSAIYLLHFLFVFFFKSFFWKS